REGYVLDTYGLVEVVYLPDPLCTDTFVLRVGVLDDARRADGDVVQPVERVAEHVVEAGAPIQHERVVFPFNTRERSRLWNPLSDLRVSSLPVQDVALVPDRSFHLVFCIRCREAAALEFVGDAGPQRGESRLLIIASGSPASYDSAVTLAEAQGVMVRCHFADVSKCTVLIIESSGNVPSWGGGSASSTLALPTCERILHSRGWRTLTDH